MVRFIINLYNEDCVFRVVFLALLVLGVYWVGNNAPAWIFNCLIGVSVTGAVVTLGMILYKRRQWKKENQE